LSTDELRQNHIPNRVTEAPAVKLIDRADKQPVSQSSTAEDRLLARYFTGAESLRSLFEHLVTAPMLPKRLFMIYGIAGVGKSSLLQIFRLHCDTMHIPVALVLRQEITSQKEILNHWADDLKVR